MVKKKKNIVNNAKEFEDLEEPVDLEDLVYTSMKFPKDDLKQLRIKSATEGVPMASILRGLLRNHFKVDSEAHEVVEEHLDDILKDCTVWGGFEIDDEYFITKMVDVGISLSVLTDREWSTVLNKLEIGFRRYHGSVSANEFVVKFLRLNPTKFQKRDLKDLARRVLKE